MKCPQCQGTGAANPDCWLCEGQMMVLVTKAIEEGYSEGDLENVEDDGYCSCPRYECRGDSCSLCEGSGEITERQRDDEITRVLIYGLTQRIPHQPVTLPNGRVVWVDEYLFSFAGAVCREKGWVHWYTSMFGDEVYLTPAGEAEVRARAQAWDRRRDVTIGPFDDLGRFDDDGAPHHRGSVD